MTSNDILGVSIRGRFRAFFLSIILVLVEGIICCMDWKSDWGTPEDDSDDNIDEDIDEDIEAIFNFLFKTDFHTKQVTQHSIY
jgi:hypothetical protein